MKVFEGDRADAGLDELTERELKELNSMYYGTFQHIKGHNVIKCISIDEDDSARIVSIIIHYHWSDYHIQFTTVAGLNVMNVTYHERYITLK